MSAIEQAQAWAESDWDETTQAALLAVIAVAQGGDDQAQAELEDAFSGRLEFGTAGLRGKLGAGMNRMNHVTVARAAQGVGAYVLAHGGRRIVIGYDARHGSKDFAHSSAQILAGLGIDALVFASHCPTPVLAYSIRVLGADAGIMVTASHNPREDNGYKVYLGDGRQIVPPADRDISALIDAAYERGGQPARGVYSEVGPEIVDGYIDDTANLVDLGADSTLRVAYTPLHGVGGDTMAAVMKKIRPAAFYTTRSQDTPDPDFPTCPKPNPEEDGVMDAVRQVAISRVTDLAIASDPDADRCAVLVRHRGKLIGLTGDDLGAVLGAYMLRKNAEGSVANSLVSSTLLGKEAQRLGRSHEQTLTGFKWITRARDLMFGYEEALGYCVAPELVFDKDGISAGVVVCELADRLKRDGRTLIDALEDLWRMHGVHYNAQVSIRCANPKAGVDMLLAQQPGHIAGIAVDTLEDMNSGALATTGVRIRLVSGDRVIVRPSGTEAKTKCYIQVVEPVNGSIDAAHECAQARSERIGAWMSELLG